METHKVPGQGLFEQEKDKAGILQRIGSDSPLSALTSPISAEEEVISWWRHVIWHRKRMKRKENGYP